ncbi:dihydrolipoyllysine-residue acetyltransferase [Legionella dresdenensis]|uniref:Acetyltransferase component of pyruvate dehydrogenase complex n=1 Tax=Legionella dresdenensis TaxID=450200 RepID=A0ABV8CBR6_9GAMM
MADEIKIKIPDIGGASGVDVIEILVKEGDNIEVDTPLITLESDKASMEIPSPEAGQVGKILVKIGDKVSEGDAIVTLLANGLASKEEKAETVREESKAETVKAEEQPKAAPVSKTEKMDVVIPDIGGASDVDVIEIMVKEGDRIEKDQALITLEGDKATMDIPSPEAGVVERVALKIGDKVSQGSLILVMTAEKASQEPQQTTVTPPADKTAAEAEPAKPEAASPAAEDLPPPAIDSTLISAGPAVRRMARELGVNLSELAGTGRKNRITREDVQQYVKKRLAEKPSGQGLALPQNPVIDFSKFGTVETRPLNKIKRLTGANVHRSWITIPHVTQFDEADITELEAFRKAESEAASREGYKLTILAFVTKVVYKALTVFPQFNASLDASGENLVYKQYYNIGIAAETPNGLVVPVIKGVDALSVKDIAIEMANLSKKARDKGLSPAEMSGGCFTISSLGGIGGTAFTPIVNSPEVAILGLSRSAIKPVFDQGEFKPRLMLPLSLSYDHRVIDGAEAARFTRYLAESLADIRRILL